MLEPWFVSFAQWSLIILVGLIFILGFLILLLQAWAKLQPHVQFLVFRSTKDLHVCPRCRARIYVMKIPPMLYLSSGAAEAGGFAVACECTKGHLRRTEKAAYLDYLNQYKEN